MNSLFSFIFSSSTIFFPLQIFLSFFPRPAAVPGVLFYSILSLFCFPFTFCHVHGNCCHQYPFPLVMDLFFSSSFFLLSFFSFYVLFLTLTYTLFCCINFCLFRCFSLYHFSSSFCHIPLSVSGFRSLGTTRWTTARLSQRLASLDKSSWSWQMVCRKEASYISTTGLPLPF